MKKFATILLVNLLLLSTTSCEFENLFNEDEESCLRFDRGNIDFPNSGEFYIGNTYKMAYSITNNCSIPFTILDIEKEENLTTFFIEGLQINKKIDAKSTTFYLIFKPQKTGLNSFEYTIVTSLQSSKFIHNIYVK